MTFIQDEAALHDAARAMTGATLLAVDTEAAGYHRYRDRICLVQASTRTETFVIDALALPDLEPLARVLEDPAIEIVLHDADYDLRLLARDYGLRVANLFDTKIAAQLAGEPAIGLAFLVEKHLGVHLDKKHQRADWAKRPLSPELLAYAAEDTRHLPELRDALAARLAELGRLHWAEEEFRLLETEAREPAPADPEAFRRLKNTADLTPRQLAALRELFAWRESVAANRDTAPFRVVMNDTLVAVARALPHNLAALSALPEVPSRVAARYGSDMLDAVRRARQLPDSALPAPAQRRRRPPTDPDLDRTIAHLKAVRDAAADELALDRGFLMPRQQLEQVARLRPDRPERLREAQGVRDWQIEAIGDRLIAALKRD